MDCLARVGQSQAEQGAGDQFAAEPDDHLAEVHLGLPARQVFLRDKGGRWFAAGLDPDRPAPRGDVLPDHPVRHLGRVVFVEEPVEDPLRGVLLLPRRVQILPQPPVDHPAIRIEP